MSERQRIERVRHDAKLFGWKVAVVDGWLNISHERGAQLVWPAPRTDVHEATLLAILRSLIPMSEADEHALRMRRMRRAEAIATKAKAADGAGP